MAEPSEPTVEDRVEILEDQVDGLIAAKRHGVLIDCDAPNPFQLQVVPSAVPPGCSRAGLARDILLKLLGGGVVGRFSDCDGGGVALCLSGAADDGRSASVAIEGMEVEAVRMADALLAALEKSP